MEKYIMKTKEELNVIKEEVETLNKKLAELTDEELEQYSGGDFIPEVECATKNNTSVNSCPFQMKTPGKCSGCRFFDDGEFTIIR